MQAIVIYPLHFLCEVIPGSKMKQYNPVQKQCKMLKVLSWVNLKFLMAIEIVLTATWMKETLLIYNTNSKTQ